MGHEAAVLQSITGEPIALTSVAAKGKVNGLLFDLAVEQRYRNCTATNIEAVYTFPLSSAAVLLELTVRLGDKELAGVVVERREAEERYEEALDKGDSAILLEQAGDGLCTMNLGNLMAGEEAVIRYRYAQLLRFEQGSVRITVPTVIAPRYGDPAAGRLRPHQVPTTDLRAEYPFALDIALVGAIASGAIASPSHRITSTRTADGLDVSIAGAAFLDRDFVLTVEGLPEQSLAVVAKDGDGYVALASVCAEIPKAADAVPLRLKLLLDCSGSMNGDSIAAAKRALHRILECLRPADRFTFSRFGSTVQHEIDRFTAADVSGVRAASRLVAGIDANLGGTEMEAALRSVFQLDAANTPGARGVPNRGHVPDAGADVFLITDGEIHAADSLVDAARAAGQRVFVTGIGSSPNESVIRRLAEATGGACEFIAPNEDAEAGILRMFARLRAPQIARAEVTWPIAPLWTTPLPRGLFGGETINVYAGFATVPAGSAVLHLHPTVEGKPLVASVPLPAHPEEDTTLARMAAASRIVSADEVGQLALALQYSLLTERTSFVVVHQRAEGEKAMDLPTLATVAQMHAAGWGGVGSVCEMRRVSRHMMSAAPPDLCYDMPAFCISPPAAIEADSADLDAFALHERARRKVTDDAFAIDRLLQRLASSSRRFGRLALPSTRRELERAGAPDSLLAAVDALVRQRYSEADAVRALLGALAPYAARLGVSRQLARELRKKHDDGDSFPELQREAAEAVARLVDGSSDPSLGPSLVERDAR